VLPPGPGEAGDAWPPLAPPGSEHLVPPSDEGNDPSPTATRSVGSVADLVVGADPRPNSIMTCGTGRGAGCGKETAARSFVWYRLPDGSPALGRRPASNADLVAGHRGRGKGATTNRLGGIGRGPGRGCKRVAMVPASGLSFGVSAVAGTTRTARVSGPARRAVPVVGITRLTGVAERAVCPPCNFFSSPCFSLAHAAPNARHRSRGAAEHGVAARLAVPIGSQTSISTTTSGCGSPGSSPTKRAGPRLVRCCPCPGVRVTMNHNRDRQRRSAVPAAIRLSAGASHRAHGAVDGARHSPPARPRDRNAFPQTRPSPT